ncbi:TPA: Imm59 family immunity protein, partial [Listeria monocytogenes]
LKEYKKILEEDIYLLGYQELRYAIFEGEKNNRQEYQVRIEKNEAKFEVYMTADRASVMGKYEFEDIFQAFNQFLNIMQLTVLSNRKRVKDGELPEYFCPLWEK